MDRINTIDELMADALEKISDFKGQEKIATESEILKQFRNLLAKRYLPYDKEAFKKLCRYLAAPNGKGLFLTGKAGTGKTHFLKTCFPYLALAPASALAMAYLENQGKLNDGFWYDAFGIWGSQTERYSLVIDDIGQEQIASSYGNTLEVVGMVICHRYKDWQNYGVKTHLSSNKSIKELDARYGRRVTDRIVEMCQVVTFTADSVRGQIKPAKAQISTKRVIPPEDIADPDIEAQKAKEAING